MMIQVLRPPWLGVLLCLLLAAPAHGQAEERAWNFRESLERERTTQLYYEIRRTINIARDVADEVTDLRKTIEWHQKEIAALTRQGGGEEVRARLRYHRVRIDLNVDLLARTVERLEFLTRKLEGFSAEYQPLAQKYPDIPAHFEGRTAQSGRPDS